MLYHRTGCVDRWARPEPSAKGIRRSGTASLATLTAPIDMPTTTAKTATLKFLQAPTQEAWIEQAIANLDTICWIVPTANARQLARRSRLCFAILPVPIWGLADLRFERSLLTRRLTELAAIESEILATLHPEPRIHS